jgi:hypothetical protein
MSFSGNLEAYGLAIAGLNGSLLSFAIIGLSSIYLEFVLVSIINIL